MPELHAAYFFGDSHVEAVRHALETSNKTEHRMLNLFHLGRAVEPAIFSDRLLLETLTPPERLSCLYVSMLGGNAHNVLGLIQPPQSFDFILPDEPDLPVAAGAELQTYDYVEASLAALMTFYSAMLASARTVFSGRMFQLESPPPAKEDDYIRRELDPYFLSGLRDRPISPAILRYKLWRTHSNITKDICKRVGVDFIAAPGQTMTEGRFLRPEYYENATHANRGYGLALLEQVEARLN